MTPEQQQKQQAAWGHFRLSLNGILAPLQMPELGGYVNRYAIEVREQIEAEAKRLHENLVERG